MSGQPHSSEGASRQPGAGAEVCPRERDHRDERWRRYVERIADGDQTAMAALFKESGSISSWMSRRILRRTEDAEEVMSDAYAQLWRMAEHYDSAKGGVSNWIVLLVRSRALDLARRQSSRSRWEVDLAPQHRERCREMSPEQMEVQRSEVCTVRSALAQIPPDERHLLELAYDEELTHAAISVRTGLPLGTVKTRIRRGLARMRGLLDGTTRQRTAISPAKFRAA